MSNDTNMGVNKQKQKWSKTTDGFNTHTYYLTKESNPYWFAKVYMRDGKYTFTIGERVKDGEPTPKRFSWNKKGFKSAATAKAKALININIKTHE